MTVYVARCQISSLPFRLIPSRPVTAVPARERGGAWWLGAGGLAALAELTRLRENARSFANRRNAPELARLPRVSLLVPLFREREIDGRLLRRLDRLAYPRELLEICLIAEENDMIIQATIARAGLPPWMWLVTVPLGTLQTKPRALNYALDFTRGSIVGVGRGGRSWGSVVGVGRGGP